MAYSVKPFLMFTGEAEAALALYASVFPGAKIERLQRHGPNAGVGAGKVQLAELSLPGQRLLVTDSPAVHGFTFTPSSSLFVECESAAEVDRLAASLGEGGQAMMPAGNYGFSDRFAWVSDRFGVSWQLNFKPAS